MQVEVEVNFRSSLDEAGRTLREDIAVLSDGVFVEERALHAAIGRHQIRIIGYEAGHGVVHNAEAFGRFGFDCLYPTVRSQMRIHDDVLPSIRRAGRKNLVPGQRHYQIWSEMEA